MKEIIAHPGFQKKLKAIAEKEKRSFSEVQAEASQYIEELYTERQELSSFFAMGSFQYIVSRGYGKKIDVVPEEIRKIMKLSHRHPIAFLFTHKTYIDALVLVVTLARYGMPIPFMFAGINMAFAGLKQLGKGSGMIYIRRSFKDNSVYKTSLRHFLATQINKGQHFTWAIEGTRSRTGKILWPKMGILKYIIEGEQESNRKIKYIPVSIVYDLIPDVKEMTEEGRGKNKKKESLLWFLNYIKKMGSQFGRAAIRFGDPVEIDGYHSAIIPDREEESYLDKNTLPRFAFELVYRANQINPVTTISLICNVLLSNYALSKKEIELEVHQLMQIIEERKPNVLLDRGKSIGKSVQSALNLLTRADIVQKTKFGLNAKYLLNETEYLPANYYANMAASHLYHLAFIELALIKIIKDHSSKRLIHFWEEIMKLRDLFKFEFFYSNKAKFSDEIEEELAMFTPNWKDILKNPKGDISAMLQKQSLFVAKPILLNYLEAYQVVIQTLVNHDNKAKFSDKEFINACIFTGKEMHWQGRIRRLESVSKPFLINGLRLAKNRNLTPGQEAFSKEKLIKTLNNLNELILRLETLQNFLIKKSSSKPNEIPLKLEIVPGSNLEILSETIVQKEEGSHIAAFFDLDRTLINDFSAKQFIQSRFLSGKMTPKEIINQFAGLLIYAAGNKDFAQLAALSAEGIKGVEEEEFLNLGEDVYLDYLARTIYPESRAIVASHLAKGHTLVVVSAATPYQVNPIARDLLIDNVLCTEMEVKNGKFTGKVTYTCWGEGKAEAAREFANKHNINLSKSYFYTDSYEDRPLLDIVGYPQAVNPDKKLSQLAFENDWPIHRFEETLGTPLMNSLRTGLALGSIYPATWQGIVTGMRTLSWQKGVNRTMATLGDLGAKMAGLEIAIKGKENLEIHRPAVFIFNHQSNADTFIISKLLRKDVRPIAKKELENHPFGPIFKAMGVIFIDRSNKEKAINAMKPAVDALNNGISIAIAPEGTRSKNRNLGKFKKGAFHLAIQAGVPIVPVVIKNAHDAMPKGSNLLRPTYIEVVVLDGIDVPDWSLKSLDRHIEDVRAAFLQVLNE